ncbi:hypothetical protein ACWFQ8_13560 [Streptomyces sp. NPDC055254]
MPDPVTIPVTELQLGPTAFRGAGQARSLDLCQAPGHPMVLIKWYTAQARNVLDPDALAALVEWRLRLKPSDRAELDRRCAWPRAAVTDDDGVCGVLIAPAGEDFGDTLRRGGRSVARPRAIDDLARTRKAAVRVGLPYYEAPLKLAVLARLVETTQWLHSHGFAVGDLQPKNALFAIEGGIRVHLIDCDSCVILDGTPPVFPPADPESWKLPGADGFSEVTDYGKLAWSVVRCVQENLEATTIDEAGLRTVIDSPTLETIADCSRGEVLPNAAGVWASRARAWPRLVTPSGLYVTVDGSLLRRWDPSSPVPDPASSPPAPGSADASAPHSAAASPDVAGGRAADPDPDPDLDPVQVPDPPTEAGFVPSGPAGAAAGNRRTPPPGRKDDIVDRVMCVLAVVLGLAALVLAGYGAYAGATWLVGLF